MKYFKMLKMKRKEIKFTLCHQMPERSFHYRGKQFPICARCTGILVGYFTLPIFHFNIIQPTVLVIFVFMFPLLLDSITQSMGYRESNNVLRFVTGFLGGAAQVAFIVLFARFLASLL